MYFLRKEICKSPLNLTLLIHNFVTWSYIIWKHSAPSSQGFQLIFIISIRVVVTMNYV